jgi:hypothetical protein
MPKWVQVKVLRVISPVVYEVQLPPRWRCHNVFHVSLLRPFKTSATFGDREYERPAPDLIEGTEEFEVECITAERKVGRGRVEYLVRWRGYPPEDDTWQPEASLVNASEILQKWKNTRA